jgi:hypothetical protein
LRLPGWAASGSIYEPVVERETFPTVPNLFKAAERF